MTGSWRDIPILGKLVITLLVLTLITSTVNGLLTHSKMVDLVGRKTEQYTNDVLNQVSIAIGVKLEEVVHMAYQIFTDPLIQNSLVTQDRGEAGPLEQIDIMRKVEALLVQSIFARTGIDSILLIPSSGPSWASTRSLEQRSLPESLRRQADLLKGGVAYGSWDQQSKSLPLAMVVNDLRTQRPLGYLVIFLDVNYLRMSFAEAQLSEGGSMYIVDSSDRPVTSSDGTPAASVLPASQRHGESGLIQRSERNVHAYVAWHRIPSTDWTIVGSIPKTEYEREIVFIGNWILLASVIGSVLSIGLGFLFSRLISDPLRALSQAMQEVEKGNFLVKLHHEGRDEMGKLVHGFNQMVERLDVMIRREYEANLRRQAAELESLKMQINPHFLYNTLESINWMARANGDNDVADMVKALGDLMRASISGKDTIPLAIELSNISNYLLIQRYRYGDRLAFEIDCPQELLGTQVPKLIAQPLVENAIVHGLEPKIDPVLIRVAVSANDAKLMISVRDTGVGIPADVAERLMSDTTDLDGHIGLSNVRRRIQVAYGSDFGLTIRSPEAGGTEVVLTLPIDSPPHFEK